MRKCTWFLHLDLVAKGRCVSSQSLFMASSKLADSGLLSCLLLSLLTVSSNPNLTILMVKCLVDI